MHEIKRSYVPENKHTIKLPEEFPEKTHLFKNRMFRNLSNSGVDPRAGGSELFFWLGPFFFISFFS